VILVCYPYFVVYDLIWLFVALVRDFRFVVVFFVIYEVWCLCLACRT
jgi:hypothetical protein